MNGGHKMLFGHTHTRSFSNVYKSNSVANTNDYFCHPIARMLNTDLKFTQLSSIYSKKAKNKKQIKSTTTVLATMMNSLNTAASHTGTPGKMTTRGLTSRRPFRPKDLNSPSPVKNKKKPSSSNKTNKKSTTTVSR